MSRRQKELILLLIPVVLFTIWKNFYFYEQEIDVSPLAFCKIDNSKEFVYGIPGATVHTQDGYNFGSNDYRRDQIGDWVAVNYGAVNINVYRYKTRQEALNSFLDDTLYRRQETKTFSQFNRYYVTYIERIANAGNFYLPVNSFTSKVVFLKGDLILDFYQASEDLDISTKEQAIKKLASYVDRNYMKSR